MCIYSNWELGSVQVSLNDDLGMTLTYLMARSILLFSLEYTKILSMYMFVNLAHI